MHNITQVFLYEIRRNFARKGYLFLTFGLPVLAIAAVLFFGSLARADSGEENGDGQDQEQETSALLEFSGLEIAGYVDLSGVYDDVTPPEDVLVKYESVDEAQAAMETGEIDAYYIISADYLESSEVIMVLPELSVTQIQERPLRWLRDLKLDQEVSDENVAQRLQAPSVYRDTNLDRPTPNGTSRTEEDSFGAVYIFAIVFMLSIFLTNGYLMQSVIEEKETRLIEILLATLRPVQLLIGKVLALGMLGLVQVLAWVGTILFLASIALGETTGILATVANLYVPLSIVPFLLIYFVLGYTMFAALFGAVGAISNSMQEGPQYAVVFTLPAVIPFYFFPVFIETPNAAVATFLSMFPLTAPLAMIQRLVVTDVPLIQIVISVGILVLTCFAVFWLAGRLFRVQTLLAGQMPRLRDIPKLIRG